MCLNMFQEMVHKYDHISTALIRLILLNPGVVQIYESGIINLLIPHHFHHHFHRRYRHRRLAPSYTIQTVFWRAG